MTGTDNEESIPAFRLQRQVRDECENLYKHEGFTTSGGRASVLQFRAAVSPFHRTTLKDKALIMDDSQAHAKISPQPLNILTALAEGVHPLTGEVFPADCPYHSPEIVRALYGAIRLLETAANVRPVPKPADRPREGAPANAGKPWGIEEDRQLLVEFDAGKTMKDIAVLHQRTYAGIEARLEKLGRLNPDERTTSRRVPAQGKRVDSRAGAGRSS